MKQLFNDFAKGLWKENPVLVLLLGTCPTLATTSSALNGFAMGIATTCVLCGSKAGLSLKNNKLVINKVELGRQVVTSVDCAAGGVAFYDGASCTPSDAEARAWIDAIVNDTEQIVKPEQAMVVSEILEAIYVSSETGKPVFFE